MGIPFIDIVVDENIGRMFYFLRDEGGCMEQFVSNYAQQKHRKPIKVGYNNSFCLRASLLLCAI